MIAFQSLTAFMLDPIAELVGAGGAMQEAEGHLVRLDDVMGFDAVRSQCAAETLPGPSAGDMADPGLSAGSLELSGVGFGYSPLAAPLITNINLSVQPGQWVTPVVKKAQTCLPSLVGVGPLNPNTAWPQYRSNRFLSIANCWSRICFSISRLWAKAFGADAVVVGALGSSALSASTTSALACSSNGRSGAELAGKVGVGTALFVSQPLEFGVGADPEDSAGLLIHAEQV